MTSIPLTHPLLLVDWNKNVAEFVKDEFAAKLDICNLRMAIWSKQFEQVDKGNPALAFVREMQSSGHYVAALSALHLYKPAAASIRTVVETALYYIYFRSHHVELSTLVRDKEFYIGKSYIIDYLKLHEPEFKKMQDRLGVIARLTDVYAYLSAIVHGQLPGDWTAHTGIADIKLNKAVLEDVVKRFIEAEELVHRLFLCTVAQSLWSDFSTPGKKALLKGLSGEMKVALNLDAA